MLPTVLYLFIAMQVSPAKQAFEDGKRAYNLGKYEDAIVLFEKSYQESGQAVLLFNLGQSQRLAGHKAEAISTYKAYLREDPNTKIRSLVESKLRELEETPATTATAPTSLKYIPPQPSDVVDPFVDPFAPVVTAPAPAARRAPSRWSTRTIAAAVATGVLTSAAVIVGLGANSLHTSLATGCAKTGGCSNSQVNDLRSRALFTNILLAGSAGAGVTTGVFFYLDF